MYDAGGDAQKPNAQKANVRAGAEAARLADAALAWYDRHRRALPWRAPPGETADPYVVWLSEIMLQQTTVAAVKPYFAAFLSRWPTLDALARAPAEQVMQAWAGLGYYSRARNLIACARLVSERFDGKFPQEEAQLRALPGLGPYTAAAVAAIAFGRRAAVVDGNVERVLARLYAVATPLPASRPELRRLADAVTPQDRPGDFAQAMMDLGATICTPRQPACALCPLALSCAARHLGDPARFPLKAAKRERPLRRGAAFYVTRPDGSALVRTRPDKGLLGAMTEFPGSPWSEEFDEAEALGCAPLAARWRRLEQPVAHVFTHFALRLSVYVAQAEPDRPAPEGCRWAARGGREEALPSVMAKVQRAAQRAD